LSDQSEVANAQFKLTVMSRTAKYKSQNYRAAV
jgi:hypothetical protein